MKKIKKMIGVILAVVMCLNLTVQAFATNVDPDKLVAKYVPELLEMSEEEIAALSYNEMDRIFWDIFGVSADNFPEEDARLAVETWANIMKIDVAMRVTDGLKRAAQKASTTAGISYNNVDGLSWVRDTTTLTYTEIISQYYYWEVDFFPRSAALTLAAASKDESNYTLLKNMADQGKSAAEITAAIFESLGMAAVGSLAQIGILAVLVLEYAQICYFEAGTVQRLAKSMTDSQELRVVFAFSSGRVLRNYDLVTKKTFHDNPAGGKAGFWYQGVCHSCDFGYSF